MRSIVASLGYELWGYEQQPQGSRQLLRIYIEKEDGISLDDCAQVSRQLATALAVENPQNDYALEVSSPGMDRVFFTLEQCRRYVGKKIKVKLLQAVDERKRLVGMLTQVNDADIVLCVDDENIVVQWNNVAKARLVAEDTIPQRKKGK